MDDKRSQLQNLRIERKNESGSSGRFAPAAVFLGIFAGILIGLGAGYFLFQQKDRQGPVQAARIASQPVAAEKAEPASASSSRQVLTASGYVTARRVATVSSEITGRILEVLVEEGMAVEEGQIVAKLDNTLAATELRLAEAQEAAARAGIQSAEAELAEARRVLARNQSLAEQKNVSEAVLTSSQARLETAVAGLAQARAQAEVAHEEVARRIENVDKHLVRAPFSGVVVQKNAQPGEIISPVSAGGGFTRTGVCTVVDMDSLEIEVDVNESFIGRVRAGQAVEAYLDAYSDWQIPASVIAIVPTADRSKATVRVRIGLHVKDQRILPEMGVKVTFLDEQYTGAGDTGSSR